MKWFMVKAFFLLSFMFIAVLFGMQLANEGINNMKGYDDANFKDAFTVNENEGGELQASILGNNISSHDLQQKKEKLEEMKAYNFFSSLGKSLSEGISGATEKGIDHLTNLINGE
ncbi:YqxA family protein [Cytobacillus sp. FJAT-53684]|uniref:YqxA family protein n=1 Tax=Cytobacillus mangrovibacter TaxID=3299024 RepID=A0ABW6JXW3_9BACI